MELNEKSIFRGFKKTANFEGNLFFNNVIFSVAKFWDYTFPKNVSFSNSVFKCPVFFNNSKFKGKLEFSSFETIGLSEFRNKVYFDNAELHELSLKRIVFETAVSFNDAKISKIVIENVHVNGFPLSLERSKIIDVEDEATARFLKTEAIKSNNHFLAMELNAKEMTMHYKGVKWTGKQFLKN